jgi:hypothetical protein
MLEKSSRPLTGTDTEKLRRRAALSWMEMLALGAVFPCSGYIAGLVAAYLLDFLKIPGQHWLIVVGALTGFCVGAVIVLAVRLYQRSLERALAADVAAGQLEVLRVNAAEVVERQERHGEGPLYFFDVGGGQVLFLGGQWLNDPKTFGFELPPPNSDTAFPVAQFQVVRAPLSGMVLSLELSGPPLAPSRKLPYKEVDVPTSGDSLLFAGTLNSLAADVQKLLAAKTA